MKDSLHDLNTRLCGFFFHELLSLASEWFIIIKSIVLNDYDRKLPLVFLDVVAQRIYLVLIN